jgi:MoaA/NifB/PqqE/SkfB family radical SAM enzyme
MPGTCGSRSQRIDGVKIQMKASSLFSGRLVNVFKRALRQGAVSPFRLLSTVAFQRRQARRRARAERNGLAVPAVLIASVTRRCNLDCAGCYAKALRPTEEAGKRAELSDERFMDLFHEAVDLGVGVIFIAGGEPLVRRGLLEKVAALRGPSALVFTNGTLIDEAMIAQFGRTMIPVFSVEGGASFTAERRGCGVHEKALAQAKAVRDRGGFFGLSVTVTSENIATVLSPAFRDSVADMGASVLFLIEFVPVAPDSAHLVLSDAQRAALNDPELAAGMPCPVIGLPGDEESYGGCMAAGRGFIHLAPDGRLEACPFAPFSDTNAGEVGLAAALNSKLMRDIRAHHHELTETRGGCALVDKAGWVASLGACSG